MEDLLLRLSYNLSSISSISFEQFSLLFCSTILRAALINLKAYIDKEHSTPLDLRLLEYRRSIYLKAISNSPKEVRIMRAIIQHKSKQEFINL